MSSHDQVTQEMRDAFDAVCKGRVEAAVKAERERLLQAVEEMRPVQDNPLLQNKPPEFWISNFKKVIEARGNT
jgi:hypothetical protein